MSYIGRVTSLSSGTAAPLVTYTNSGAGAVQTNVQSKLEETVSVKDFGAVGDGVTDDTAAIQAALDYCTSFDSTKVNGMPLTVTLKLSGMHLITSSLIIDRPENVGSQFRIVGEGQSGSLVTNSAINIIDSSYTSALSQNIVFDNVSFSSTISTSYVLNVEKFARIVFSKCFFTGIRLTKALTAGKFMQLVQITGCYARNIPGKFIESRTLYGVDVFDSLFEVITDDVFSVVEESVGCAFTGNTIETNQGKVFDFGTSAEGVCISGNYFENNIGRVLTVGIAAGLDFSGNYINTRQTAPDNRSDTSFFEVSIAESQGFIGAGNKFSTRGYEFTGTGPFTASVGLGDDVGVQLINNTNSNLVVNNLSGSVQVTGNKALGVGAQLTLRNSDTGFSNENIITFNHGSEPKAAIRSKIEGTGSGAGQLFFEIENDSNVYEKVATLASDGLSILTDGGAGNFRVGDVATATAAGEAGVYITNTSDTYGRINIAKSSASGTGATYLLRSYYEGAAVGGITSSSTATALVTSSDYRLKEDVQPMTNASARIESINPVNFAWKSDGSRVDGFLAHELAEVVPEAVVGEKDALDDNGDPEYQGVDQSKLVPLLVASLQDALARIKVLEEKLTNQP